MFKNDLIKGCIKKDRTAQHKIYADYYPVVYATCMRYANDSDEAKDMTQEVFIRLFDKIKQYKGEGSFEGWVRRIAVNTSINIYKKNKKHKNYSQLDEDHLPENEIPEDLSENDFDIKTIEMDELTSEKFTIDTVSKAGFSYEELTDVLKTLPEPFRIVFNLFILEEYSHEQIAKLLNINIKTSWSRLSRAKQMFQKRLCEETMKKLID